MRSRQEIVLAEYNKTIHIEALTSLDLLRKSILPACLAYSKTLADGIAIKGPRRVPVEAETKLVEKVSQLTNQLYEKAEQLETTLSSLPEESLEAARYYNHTVLPAMEAARSVADQLELCVAREYWPMPSYSDLLFYI